MIVVDTSVLIDSLTAARRGEFLLRQTLASGARLMVPAVVLYEWTRGKRLPEELAGQSALFPTRETLAFGVEEALVAADLYRKVTRPRGREIDLIIAAHALVQRAAIWTLNHKDFRDIPGVRLHP